MSAVMFSWYKEQTCYYVLIYAVLALIGFLPSLLLSLIQRLQSFVFAIRVVFAAQQESRPFSSVLESLSDRFAYASKLFAVPCPA